MGKFIAIGAVLVAGAIILFVCMNKVANMRGAEDMQPSGTSISASESPLKLGNSMTRDQPPGRMIRDLSLRRDLHQPFRAFQWSPATQKVMVSLGVNSDDEKILQTPYLRSVLMHCISIWSDHDGIDFEQMGLDIPGLQAQATDLPSELRKAFGLALGARASPCISVMAKWEHYLMHASLAPHVKRFFSEQAGQSDRNFCSQCSSCHRYNSESACTVPEPGRQLAERKAVIATVALVYRMWQLVPPLPYVTMLLRLEDTFDGWGLQFREYQKCREGAVAERFPYDLHVCRNRLLKEGTQLTLATSMTFFNRKDWPLSDPEEYGLLRWEVYPPPGQKYIVGAMPTKTHLMRCATCNRQESFQWDTSAAGLVPGSALRIEAVSVDEITSCTTVHARQL